MLETTMTLRALEIAKAAHDGQTDKAGRPYVEHPIHLAEMMATEEETCTALLHDVVEDSDWTIDDLASAGFSETILSAVSTLTHDDGSPYFDYIERVRENPLAAKVKVADLQHNSDLGRIESPTEKDHQRLAKYAKALRMLQSPKAP